MRYTFVRRKGNHGQIVIKKSWWIVDPPLESMGGAGENKGGFGKVLQLKKESLRVFVVLGGRGIDYARDVALH